MTHLDTDRKIENPCTYYSWGLYLQMRNNKPFAWLSFSVKLNSFSYSSQFAWDSATKLCIFCNYFYKQSQLSRIYTGP